MSTTTSDDRSFFGHPRGLSTLFFTEMWERFSYYGMRAFLILFMTAPIAAGGLGFPVVQAGAVYGTYAATVYLMTMVGGWVADNLLGYHRSVFWGGVLIMCGHISLAVPTIGTFYLGLLLVVFGTGLLKGNVSTIVGQLYAPEDTRRDAAYSLYYMGVNLGGMLGPIVAGWLAQGEGFKQILAGWGLPPSAAWHFGFGAAAVGMFCGLVQYTLGRKRMPAAAHVPLGATTPEQMAGSRRTALRVVIGVIALAVLAVLAQSLGVIHISATGVAGAMDFVLFGVVVGFFGWLFLGGTWTPAERKRLVVIFVLFFGALVFWSTFEQAGSTLNLFADRNTANTIFGISYPASWLQSVNSLFIVLFAPVFAWIWLRLGKRDPSSPTKFAIGLFFLASSAAVMMAAAMAASGGAKVSPMWLIACYFLQTVGELCLSPVGLSAMSRLAPARVAGLMMGVWFLAASVGNKVAGRVGGLFESLSLTTIFGGNTVVVLFFAVLMVLLIRPIKRMMESA